MDAARFASSTHGTFACTNCPETAFKTNHLVKSVHHQLIATHVVCFLQRINLRNASITSIMLKATHGIHHSLDLSLESVHPRIHIPAVSQMSSNCVLAPSPRRFVNFQITNCASTAITFSQYFHTDLRLVVKTLLSSILASSLPIGIQ